MAIKTLANFSPGRTILLSFFFTILLGTLLLALPVAQKTSIPLIDLFFMATSATCVTGLFSVPLDQLTTFGQGIILLLIQIGGLGLITMTLFIMSLFINLGLTTQFMAGQLLEIDAMHHLKKIICHILMITFITELIGACCIFSVLRHDYPLLKAIFLSVFHAISSFCNAGISIFPGGELVTYNNNVFMLTVTMILVLCGGLGFITWREIFCNMHAWIKRKRTVFSLQTKLILSGTALTLLFLTVIFWILEHENAFASMSPFVAGINSAFHAISMRSAGFLTVPINQLHLASILVIMAAAFIGSAPGSTGSGIKITTFIVLIATIKAGLSDKVSVDIKGRRIARDQLYKAFTIIGLSIFWLLLSLFLLLITEDKIGFFELTLEAVSAFTNLGLSVGTSPQLSWLGKSIIMISMLVGRIGSVTLILALKKRKKEITEFSYPEERIMLG